MRLATLAAVVTGGSIFGLDLLLVRLAHERDPFYWLSLAVFIAAICAGAYVRRHDPPIRRRVDGLGVTAGIRASLGLWDPSEHH